MARYVRLTLLFRPSENVAGTRTSAGGVKSLRAFPQLLPGPSRPRAPFRSVPSPAFDFSAFKRLSSLSGCLQLGRISGTGPRAHFGVHSASVDDSGAGPDDAAAARSAGPVAAAGASGRGDPHIGLPELIPGEGPPPPTPRKQRRPRATSGRRLSAGPGVYSDYNVPAIRHAHLQISFCA